MPKVICTLENAAEEISGVKFITHALGMISEDISDEDAERFLSIPGYEAQEKDPEVLATEMSALRARAAALNMPVKGNWGEARLLAEIEKAEKQAAGATA